MGFNFILPAGAWLSRLSLPPFTSSFWGIATTPSALLLRCTDLADMVKLASLIVLIVLVLAGHSRVICLLSSWSLMLAPLLIRNKDGCKSGKRKQTCVFCFWCENSHSSGCRSLSLKICCAHLCSKWIKVSHNYMSVPSFLIHFITILCKRTKV